MVSALNVVDQEIEAPGASDDTSVPTRASDPVQPNRLTWKM